METNHTPGPWAANSDGSAIKAGKITVADCIPDHPGDRAPREQFLPNARLVAAAPELLEVLNGFVLNWRHMNDDHFTGPRDKLLALAEAAIAKATRGQI